jgi:hypothetical protein
VRGISMPISPIKNGLSMVLVGVSSNIGFDFLSFLVCAFCFSQSANRHYNRKQKGCRL